MVGVIQLFWFVFKVCVFVLLLPFYCLILLFSCLSLDWFGLCVLLCFVIDLTVCGLILRSYLFCFMWFNLLFLIWLIFVLFLVVLFIWCLILVFILWGECTFGTGVARLWFCIGIFGGCLFPCAFGLDVGYFAVCVYLCYFTLTFGLFLFWVCVLLLVLFVWVLMVEFGGYCDVVTLMILFKSEFWVLVLICCFGILYFAFSGLRLCVIWYFVCAVLLVWLFAFGLLFWCLFIDVCNFIVFVDGLITLAVLIDCLWF